MKKGEVNMNTIIIILAGMTALMLGKLVFNVFRNLLGLVILSAGFVSCIICGTTGVVKFTESAFRAGTQAMQEMEKGTRDEIGQIINVNAINELKQYTYNFEKGVKNND